MKGKKKITGKVTSESDPVVVSTGDEVDLSVKEIPVTDSKPEDTLKAEEQQDKGKEKKAKKDKKAKTKKEKKGKKGKKK